MKTYKEWMEQSGTMIVFPREMDEGTQEAIRDWFQFREVADDDKFGVFFQRVLNRDASRYEQLLRIEPGITTYDWLVSRYTEAQRKRTGSENLSSSGSGTVTHTGTLKVENGTNYTDTHSGTDTRTVTHGHVITMAGSESVANGTVKDTGTITTEGSLSNTRAGGYSDVQTDTRIFKDSRTTSHDGDSTITTDGYSVTDQKRLEKSNPMSISYQASDMPVDPVVDVSVSGGGSNANGMALDWQSPSAQAQNYGKDRDYTTQTTHDADITDERQSYVEAGGNLTNARTYNNLKDTRSNSDTKTLDTTRTTNYTKTNGKTDTHSGTDEDGTTYGKQIRHVVDGQDVTTRNLTDENSSSGTIDKSTEDRDRYQQTGRDKDPASILRGAVSFIKGTNAFEWLTNQLEVCFIGIYD